MSGAVAAVAPAPLNIVAAVRRARNPGLGTRDSDSGDTGGGTSCVVTSTVWSVVLTILIGNIL